MKTLSTLQSEWTKIDLEAHSKIKGFWIELFHQIKRYIIINKKLQTKLNCKVELTPFIGTEESKVFGYLFWDENLIKLNSKKFKKVKTESINNKRKAELLDTIIHEISHLLAKQFKDYSHWVEFKKIYFSICTFLDTNPNINIKGLKSVKEKQINSYKFAYKK